MPRSLELLVLDGLSKVVLKYSAIIMMNGADDNIAKTNILLRNPASNPNHHAEFDIRKGSKKVASNSCSASGAVAPIRKACDHNIVVAYAAQGVYVVVVGVLLRELWVLLIKELLGSNILDVDGANP